VVLGAVEHQRRQRVGLEEPRHLAWLSLAARNLVQADAATELAGIGERLGHEVDLVPVEAARWPPQPWPVELGDVATAAIGRVHLRRKLVRLVSLAGEVVGGSNAVTLRRRLQTRRFVLLVDERQDRVEQALAI